MEFISLAYDVYVPNDMQENANPIILLHGLFWNKYMYRDLAKAICNETKRKVYCLDLRNHGESASSEECDAYLMAEDIKMFLRDHNLEKVVFITHSFSSTITYLIALDIPHVIEKMVMIDHPPFTDHTKKNFEENVYPQFAAQNRFLKTLDPHMTLAQAKQKILGLAKMGTKSQEFFLMKVAYDLDKKNGKFQWKTDHQFLIDRYREGGFWATPRGSSDHEILIIRSKDSPRLTDVKFEAVLKHNPKAKLVTFEDTTHLLMFEKAEEFVKTVSQFLAGKHEI
ncbi:ethanol acetyltransferase 1-like isoform X2 [Stegodyphus dumicola]|nr:ethanol acetyltransferase 1-like isoform X2 [Stegodyphus dumicola]XP_035213286.1 ethanol acetyltransferase 1-like isoform X2 [Stegodyphus dumicola]XP_035213293.1 ethanol acetyltransferase 1-like isoform X2 [Stegodyphus dumicola]